MNNRFLIYGFLFLLLSCEETKERFVPLVSLVEKPIEVKTNPEPITEKPTEIKPDPPWYKLGWVYLLGNRRQIIYEAEIDQWNVQGFRQESDMMNHFSDPNCPCSVESYPI